MKIMSEKLRTFLPFQEKIRKIEENPIDFLREMVHNIKCKNMCKKRKENGSGGTSDSV